MTEQTDVQRFLIRAYQYVIARFDCDGLRIDTLRYLQDDFPRLFGNSMREFALSISRFAMRSENGEPRRITFVQSWRKIMGNFFTDVISNDVRFNSTTRINDLELLEPLTRALVQEIVDGAKDLGFDVMVFETYRSQARQEELFNQHATQLRKVGVHHYGLACDIVKVINAEPSWKGDFSFLGQLAHSAGLIWGGDWGDPNRRHTFIDAVHVQRCSLARQAELFAGTFYPDDTYNPYNDDEHALFVRVAALTLPKKRARRRAA